MKEKTKKLVYASMLAALVCVSTMVIRIPSPMKGYLHVGDGVVLVCGWFLSPVYGFVSAGLGAAMADLFSGYPMYIPATFLIKGSMAITACLGYRWLLKKCHRMTARWLSAVVAECVMVIGYLLFEGILYGFAAALMNIPANLMQGAVGCVLGLILVKIFYKIIK